VQQQIDNFESSNNKTFRNIVDIIKNLLVVTMSIKTTWKIFNEEKKIKEDFLKKPRIRSESILNMRLN